MKMSEFSRITGIKRTALQLYEKKGLLKPASRTESGYWEYDDESLGRASLITILKESGYTLEEIKQILDSGDQFSITETYKACEERLCQKVKKLNGYIRYIKKAQQSAEAGRLSELVFKKLGIAAVLEKAGGMKNEMDQYNTKMEKAEEVLGPIEELDPAVEIELGALFYISLLQGKEPPEGPTAQETLQRIFAHANAHADKSFLKAEMASGFAQNAKEALETMNEQHVALIEKSCGKGCVEYVLKALDAFGKTENSR